MFSQWSKNIEWKIIDNVPFCPPNYQNIELHVLNNGVMVLTSSAMELQLGYLGFC